jgi:hypothetical protein
LYIKKTGIYENVMSIKMNYEGDIAVVETEGDTHFVAQNKDGYNLFELTNKRNKTYREIIL